MNEFGPGKTAKRGMKLAPRRAVNISEGELVRMGRVGPDGRAPVLIEPAIADLDLAAWAAGHREPLEDLLLREGAVLFRNFGLKSAEGFREFIRALAGDLMDYEFASTPRREVAEKIYTSTEYPADQHIPLHSEMSYSSAWPLKIWFWCLQPAAEGGETPLADCRRVYDRISPPVRARLEQKKIMYVRNYGVGPDLHWRTVFRTADKSQVEAYCRRAGIEWEWKSEERLTTRHVTPAVATHPKSGERVWFNQAHLFHVSSLAAETLNPLLSAVGREDLPRNAYYGDGGELEPEVLEDIRRAYAREHTAFAWRGGDVLMLDNMLMAHGRAPFSGDRRVLVGMADPYAREGL